MPRILRDTAKKNTKKIVEYISSLHKEEKIQDQQPCGESPT